MADPLSKLIVPSVTSGSGAVSTMLRESASPPLVGKECVTDVWLPAPDDHMLSKYFAAPATSGHSNFTCPESGFVTVTLGAERQVVVSVWTAVYPVRFASFFAYARHLYSVFAVSPLTTFVNAASEGVPLAVTFVHPVPPTVGVEFSGLALNTTPHSDRFAPPVAVTVPPSVAPPAPSPEIDGVPTVGAAAFTVTVIV